MRGFLRLLLAFILSGLAAGALSMQLAIWAAAREEYIVVISALALFLALATLTYAAGAILLNRRSALTVLTLGLALLIAAGVVGALALSHASPTSSDRFLLGSFSVSALIGLGVQWFVVRRLFV